MCDTIGLITSGKAFFAKNSDRSPNEPQVAEVYPAADHPSGGMLKTTYISIKQTEHTHALLLSRPTWLWGGEMGVNEFGVLERAVKTVPIEARSADAAGATASI